jgi:carbonic anhydrase/acetyltransferase-like protein (isoleucine patch superfamily)
MGHVTLGPDASVWYGCVLRGDNESMTIGEGSNIQDLRAAHRPRRAADAG